MTGQSQEIFDRLTAENQALRAENDRLRFAADPELIEVGFYTFTHRLDSATEYKRRIDRINDDLKEMIKAGTAIVAADGFIYNNSLAKGKKMVKDLAKLMLRAYNAEAENCVRTVRASNLESTLNRLERSALTIAKFGAMMDMRVAADYHRLRQAEIELTADYLMQAQWEREQEREERAQLREERRVEAELAKERERLTKEQSHYTNVLESLSADDPGRSELERRLTDLDQAISDNDFRIANVRAGYVYVISNLGAFGPGMIKIGMTRRLDPMDRVRELGDASVPFGFDVHALFFSDDAVGVEAELHRRFSDHRVNRINLRREYFYSTPQDVKVVLDDVAGALLEYTIEPVADQYRLSREAREQDASSVQLS